MAKPKKAVHVGSKSKQQKPPAAKTKPEPRVNSKQGTVFEMLGRAQGASIEAISKATGWQQHSVRGLFAGVVRKKLHLTLESEKHDGERIYRIPSSKQAKAAESADQKRQ
jgi:hypothetical protein